MRMLRSGVDLELGELLRSKPVVRQHALHGPADDLFGPSLEQMAERLALEAVRVAAVADVELRFLLVRRDGDLAGVHDDDMVAGIQRRAERWLVLPFEHASDARRQTAERLVRRVHDVPASLDLALTDRICLRRGHRSPFDLAVVRPLPRLASAASARSPPAAGRVPSRGPKPR